MPVRVGRGAARGAGPSVDALRTGRPQRPPRHGPAAARRARALGARLRAAHRPLCPDLDARRDRPAHSPRRTRRHLASRLDGNGARKDKAKRQRQRQPPQAGQPRTLAARAPGRRAARQRQHGRGGRRAPRASRPPPCASTSATRPASSARARGPRPSPSRWPAARSPRHKTRVSPDSTWGGGPPTTRPWPPTDPLRTISRLGAAARSRRSSRWAPPRSPRASRIDAGLWLFPGLVWQLVFTSVYLAAGGLCLARATLVWGPSAPPGCLLGVGVLLHGGGWLVDFLAYDGAAPMPSWKRPPVARRLPRLLPGHRPARPRALRAAREFGMWLDGLVVGFALAALVTAATALRPDRRPRRRGDGADVTDAGLPARRPRAARHLPGHVPPARLAPGRARTPLAAGLLVFAGRDTTNAIDSAKGLVGRGRYDPLWGRRGTLRPRRGRLAQPPGRVARPVDHAHAASSARRAARRPRSRCSSTTTPPADTVGCRAGRRGAPDRAVRMALLAAARWPRSRSRAERCAPTTSPAWPTAASVQRRGRGRRSRDGGRSRAAAASTSTASRRSTTRSATPPATSCCAGRRAAWRRVRAGDIARAPGRRRVRACCCAAPRRHDRRRVADRLLDALGAAVRPRRHRAARRRQHRHRALSPSTATTPNTLLRHADIAMYQAKRGAHGLVVYARRAATATAATASRWPASCARAIERDELTLHYQPKLDLRRARSLGVEALVRWRHPERGLLAPGAFIPLAEQTELMRALSRPACCAMAICQAALGDAGLDLAVAVNVSAADLLDRALLADVAALLGRTDAAAPAHARDHREPLMTDPARAARARASCASWASGSRSTTSAPAIRRSRTCAPARRRAQDRPLVRRGDGHRATPAAIVRSTIDLAHALGLRVVAEGIEDEATWRLLRAVGCDAAQGYHLSRPIPAGEFETARRRRSASARAWRRTLPFQPPDRCRIPLGASLAPFASYGRPFAFEEAVPWSSFGVRSGQTRRETGTQSQRSHADGSATGSLGGPHQGWCGTWQQGGQPMDAPTDFAHAAAIERILRAHGIGSMPAGSGDRSHLGDGPLWGHGRRRRWGRRVCGPRVRSPGGAEGLPPLSKRRDGPGAHRPARRAFRARNDRVRTAPDRRRRLAAYSWASDRPVTGPSATPGALVAGGDPQPGDVLRRADRGQVVGQPRPQAGPGRVDRQLAQARHRGGRRARASRRSRRRRRRGRSRAARGSSRRARRPPTSSRAPWSPAGRRPRSRRSRGSRRRRPCGGRARLGSRGRRREPHELALARLERQRRAPARRGERRRSTARRRARRRRARAARPRRCGRRSRAAPGRPRSPRPSRRADHGARGGRLARERAGDRARGALQVGREEGRAVQRARQPRLTLAPRRRLEQLAPRRPRRAAARRARARAAHVSASGWTMSAPLRRIARLLAEPRVELVVDGEPGDVRSSSGPASLSRAEDVALPQPGRPARHGAAVEQGDVDAARPRSSRAHAAPTMPGAARPRPRPPSQGEAGREGVVARRGGTGPSR